VSRNGKDRSNARQEARGRSKQISVNKTSNMTPINQGKKHNAINSHMKIHDENDGDGVIIDDRSARMRELIQNNKSAN